MSEAVAIKLAVVAEESLQQHRLRSAIEDFGCEVVCLSPQILALKGIDESISAWLVDVREDDQLLEFFCDIDRPVLLGFEAAPSKQDSQYPKWEKRLYAKLKNLLGTDLIQAKNTQASINIFERLSLQEQPAEKSLTSYVWGEQADNVWVLGSSLGGPEAIKEFLDSLPQGLPVGFIYGQHIDAQFVPVLAQVLARHAHFKLSVAEAGMKICNGQVLIVPADKEVTFENGQVVILEQPWPGPYGPSVDQLIVNTLKSFPDSGVILFSGMGNDGADAVQHLKEQGIEIWAQSADSCASAAMPDASRETGAVSFSGTPTELAKQLVRHIEIKSAGSIHATTNK